MAKKKPKWLIEEEQKTTKLSNGDLLNTLIDTAISHGSDYGDDRDETRLYVYENELRRRLEEVGFLVA